MAASRPAASAGARKLVPSASVKVMFSPARPHRAGLWPDLLDGRPGKSRAWAEGGKQRDHGDRRLDGEEEQVEGRYGAVDDDACQPAEGRRADEHGRGPQEHGTGSASGNGPQDHRAETKVEPAEGGTGLTEAARVDYLQAEDAHRQSRVQQAEEPKRHGDGGRDVGEPAAIHESSMLPPPPARLASNRLSRWITSS